jgi:hypothetical protein
MLYLRYTTRIAAAAALAARSGRCDAKGRGRTGDRNTETGPNRTNGLTRRRSDDQTDGQSAYGVRRASDALVLPVPLPRSGRHSFARVRSLP